MTPEQVQLIRLTFVQVMNRKQEAGRLFYERLFFHRARHQADCSGLTSMPSRKS